MMAVRNVDTLVLGAGISGLTFAYTLRERQRDADVLVLERENVPGGLCRSFHVGGFTWDCSGHFLHFKDPAYRTWVADLLKGELLEIEKRTYIDWRGHRIDFPFQKNIHQLPLPDFLECL